MGTAITTTRTRRRQTTALVARRAAPREGGGAGKDQANADDRSMETAMLEKTIIKIGGLLALGFGEAGAEIIAGNMKNADGGVNAMIDGKKLQAIFGFCDIRNFTDATEILKEKVMIFVNQIAEIVHGTVDAFSGCANKNIGDAFLLVWKFPEIERDNGVREQLIDTATMNRLADLALVSFVKIIAGINKSSVLAEYREIPEIINRLGTGWKVKMGFGLHVGWAIEGAIGSEYKIDASYLSPNVNMASRLEAATKQYGVYILISNELYDIMSPQVTTSLSPRQKKCSRVYTPTHLETISTRSTKATPFPFNGLRKAKPCSTRSPYSLLPPPVWRSDREPAWLIDGRH